MRNNGIQLLYVLIFLVLLFSIGFHMIKKNDLQFKLLKSLYPAKMERVKSYTHLMLAYWRTGLGFKVWLWLGIPIYYNHFKETLSSDAQLDIHKALIRNRRFLIISLVTYILWLFPIGVWLGPYLSNE